MFSPAEPSRLLLVDDEEAVLRALFRALSHQGWRIETCSDPGTALDRARLFQPQVVISDYRMPELSGIDLLAQFKRFLPQCQRMMLTGQADSKIFADAVNRAEVFRFISKPWDNDELLANVRSAFEQGSLIRENERLQAITHQQNGELKALATSLEARVLERTFALSQAKREWETAFDAIDIPLAVVDEEKKIRRFNRAFARVSEGAGAPLPSTGEPQIGHGTRQYQVSSYPIPEERASVYTWRDVTNEQAHIRQQIDTEKMAAVGQLAGGVAHEINNPLGGILAFAQLMKRDGVRSAADTEALDLIEESALRCKRIVESLLKFSRRSSGESAKLLDLSRCMEDTALLFTAQLKASPRARLELSLAPGLPEVMGNAVQLGQVALNLLQNALQALPKGEGTIKLETTASGSQVTFAVSDTGSGISPEHLPHLFEPWFTTKPPGEGTGLGLAIAHRIVADHGGHFRVDSVRGSGSRFTVTLPAGVTTT